MNSPLMRIYIKFLASQDIVKGFLITVLSCWATLLPFWDKIISRVVVVVFFSTDGFSMKFSNLIKKIVNQRDLTQNTKFSEAWIVGNLTSIKTGPEIACGEPRPNCALLPLLKPENNRNFNRNCQLNTRLVIPSFLNFLDTSMIKMSGITPGGWLMVK